MKTIILYATKYGGSAEIAKLIAAHFDEAEIYDLKKGDIPSLEAFDNVITGSSVYAGSFRNEAKIFLSQNAAQLCKKKLGLFACGMSKGESGEVFRANVPEDVLKSTTAVCMPGGIFDPAKANFFEKLIMKIVVKQSGYINTIDNEKISEFAEAMKE